MTLIEKKYLEYCDVFKSNHVAVVVEHFVRAKYRKSKFLKLAMLAGEEERGREAKSISSNEVRTLLSTGQPRK